MYIYNASKWRTKIHRSGKCFCIDNQIKKALVNLINPFPGIRSYRPEEAQLFFGRKKEIEELLKKMESSRFVSITGSSGCGKSSLILAGIIPAMKAQSDAFRYSIIRPGKQPVQNLIEALEHLFSIKKMEEPKDYQSSKNRTEELKNTIAQFPEKGENCLLVLDQFEELFRFTTDEAQSKEAQIFTDLLSDLIQGSKLRIIISMRSDFLYDCTRFPKLTELINKGNYLVPRMDRTACLEAISGPLEKMGHQLEDGFTEKILQDIGNNQDQLPIMQHALMRTWDHWQSTKRGTETLGIKHYIAAGKIEKALSIHAEEIYAELKTDRQKNICEKTFRALTEISEENRIVRRPCSLKELAGICNESEQEVKSVIELFRKPGRAFLTPPFPNTIMSETMIDISHESLMRVWVRLKKWIAEEAHSARLYKRLATSAALYQEGRAALWQDPELQLAINWKNNNHPNLRWASRYDHSFDRAMSFLHTSQNEKETKELLTQEKQKKELKRARQFVLILSAASILSILLFVYALTLMFQAEASERKAVEKEKIAVSERNTAQTERQKAIIQQKIAEQQQEIAEQQKLITEQQKQYAIAQQNIAIYERSLAEYEREKADSASVVAVQAKDEAEQRKTEALEQKQIAEAQKTKAEISENRAQRLRKLAIAKALAIQAVDLSKSIQGELPQLLALEAWRLNKENQGNPQDPDVFQALSQTTANGDQMYQHDDAIKKLQFFDNKYIIAATQDGKLIKIQASGNKDLPLLINSPVSTEFLSSGPVFGNGNLAAVTYNKDLLIFDLTNASPPKNIPLPAMIYHITSSNDQLICIDGQGQIYKYDQTNAESNPLIALQKTEAPITSCLGTKNGLYAGLKNGKLLFIHLESGEENTIINEVSHPLTAIAYDAKNKNMACANDKGQVFLIDQNGKKSSLIGHTSGVQALAFNHSGGLLASAGYDQNIRIWDCSKTDAPPLSIHNHDGWIYDLLFAEDDSEIISCGSDNQIIKTIIDPERLAKKAQQTAGRGLTIFEWQEYIGTDIPYRTETNKK